MGDIVDCGDCDAGAACGVCLMLLTADQCPDSQHDQNVAADCFSPGGLHLDGGVSSMCEGDGECGTSDLANNCAHYNDIYSRVACEGEFIVPETQPSPPPPSWPPVPPPVLPPSPPANDGMIRIAGVSLTQGGAGGLAGVWATVILLIVLLAVGVVIRRYRRDWCVIRRPGRRPKRTSGATGTEPFAFRPQFSLSRAEAEVMATELVAVPSCPSASTPADGTGPIILSVPPAAVPDALSDA